MLLLFRRFWDESLEVRPPSLQTTHRQLGWKTENVRVEGLTGVRLSKELNGAVVGSGGEHRGFGRLVGRLFSS